MRKMPLITLLLLAGCSGTQISSMNREELPEIPEPPREVAKPQKIMPDEERRSVFENIERQQELNRRARMTPHELCTENKNWKRYGSYKECISEIKAERRHEEMMRAIQVREMREEYRQKIRDDREFRERDLERQRELSRGIQDGTNTMIRGMTGFDPEPNRRTCTTTTNPYTGSQTTSCR